MLKRLRHWLVLALFLLLPFHALFVTVGTKMIFGPGHPPLPLLAVWKEVLLVILFILGICELVKGFSFQLSGFRKVLQGNEKLVWMKDWPMIFIIALLALAFIISATHYSLLTTHFVFGFKYLFLPLIFFLLLKNLSWEEGFLERRVFPGLLLVGGIVAAYGILTYFLPQSFFTALGYSDAHSLYSPQAPLSAFQLISDSSIRRIQGTFAGPNQLGIWLLLPWSMALTTFLKGERTSDTSFLVSLRNIFLLFLTGFALTLTSSRSAAIGAFIILLVVMQRKSTGTLPNIMRRTFGGAIFVVVLLTAVVFLRSPQIFLRGISTRHHLERLQEGIVLIMQKPLGRGLGSAGPASNRLSDPCLFFEEGADISWAKDRPDLCLFVGDVQVQPLPSQRACTCPLLPESWYLQVGVELGVLGFALFVALIIVILRQLILNSQFSILNLPAFFVFLGVSIAALFLHAWEDSAVAYTMWGLVGIVFAYNASVSSPSAPSRQPGSGRDVANIASA